MSFSSMATDRVFLLEQDGTEYPETTESVQANVIFIPNGHLPIEEGDTIIRRPQGVAEERFLVIDPGFHAGHANIAAHYHVI